MNDKKIALFLFIYFFAFYAFFIHWPGWNENSRFFLTRAIVDNCNLTIDPWYNQTTDRAVYKGHYYSDKPPGTSILALPIYWLVEKIFGPVKCRLYGKGITYANATIYRCEVMNASHSISMVLLTLISSFFGSLLVSLFFISTKVLTRETYPRFIASLALGMTSPLLPSSLVFQECSATAFLTFLSFCLFYRKKYLLSSALLAISVLVNYASVLILMFLLFYSLLSRKHTTFDFIKTTFLFVIFISPLLLYNFKIFGDPFKFTLQYNDRSVWKVSTQELKLFGMKSYIPDFHVTLSLLFLPPRGFIFFFPVYIFSIIGLFYGKKEYSIPLAVLFFIFLYYLSCRDFWWGGYFFGPKYFSYFIPFFTVPLIEAIKKHMNFVLPVFFISLLVSLTSLTWWDDIVDFSTGKISETFNLQIHSFDFRYNPFKHHYLPVFCQYGPISRLLIGLNLNKLDIRDTPGEYPKEMYLKFKSIDISLLITFLFTLFLFSLYLKRKCKQK